MEKWDLDSRLPPQLLLNVFLQASEMIGSLQPQNNRTSIISGQQ